MKAEQSEDEEEGNLSWGSRSHRHNVIKSQLIPRLDDEGWNERYESEPEQVEESTTILTEEYYDMAVPAFWSFTVLVILLFVVDYLVALNGQMYGLFVNIWASIFLIFPSLKGRYVIATAVEGKSSEALSRLQAQEMVTANAGFAFLALGFIFQVFSAQFLISEEFILANILSDYASWWITLILLTLTFGISSLVMAKLRDNRLAVRKAERDAE